MSILHHKIFRLPFVKGILGYVTAIIAALLFSLLASSVAQALTADKLSNNSAQAPISVIQGEKDTLVVGSEQDYPPFATGLTDATVGGFTVDLWKAVATEAGLKYTLHVQPFHELLKEFKAGKIDVLINLAMSDERHAYADFSVPHAIVHGGIFVRKGESNVSSEADLAGKSIIVLNADLAHDYVTSKGWGGQLVLVDSVAEGMRLLTSGKHDAMLISKLAGMQTLQALGLSNIEALKVNAGFSQKFTFAVQEGNAELLSKLNEGLALTKSNGTYDALYEKWFGIYEAKQVGLQDFLKYLLPVLFIFLCIAQYSIYRRKIERRAARKALQESEHHLSTLLSTIPNGVFEAKNNGEYTYINERWSQITGMSFELARGHGWANALYPEDKAGVDTEWSASVAENRPFHLEYRFIRTDGSITWVLGQATAFQSASGEIGYIGSITDITVRKLAEQAHQKIEHTLSVVLENVDAYIFLKDIQGRYLYANRKVCDLFGTSLEAIVGQGDERFFDAETVEQIRNNDRQVLLEGKVLRTEETNRKIKNRLAATYLVVKLPLRNESGEIYALCGISTEITELKLMEMQLVKNISLLNATLESTNDAILAVDLNNNWLSHNQRLIDLWHITDDMIAAKDGDATLAYMLNQLEDADAFLNKVSEFYATPEAISFDTFKFKNGKIIERYSKPQFVEGKVAGRVCSFRDVTERKQAEAKLIQRENYSRAIIEASPVPLALNDDNGNITYLNAAFIQTIGYTLSDIPTLAYWWLLAYPDPQYRQQVIDNWQKNLEEAKRTNSPFNPLEINVQCKDGSVRTLICSAANIEGDSSGTHLVVMVDITERKNAESLLKAAQSESELHNFELRKVQSELVESRDRYKDLYEFAPVGYLSVSNHGLISNINWKATAMFGLSRKHLNGRRLAEFIADDDKERWQRLFISLKKLTSGEDINFDLKFVHDDGLIFDANLTCLCMDDEVDQPMLRIALTDVTQLKQIEAKLISSESYLRNIIDNEPECIKVIDAWCNLKQMNPAGLALIEAKTLEHATSVPLIDFIAPDYRKAFLNMHKRVIAGESMQLQYEKIGLKGGRRWVETHAVPMQENGAKLFLGVSRDITERKQAENDLRIAAIAFESQEGMLITDTKGAILKVNRAFTSITGYTADEVLGKNPRLLNSGQHGAAFYDSMWKSIKDTGAWQGDIWNKRKNGEVYPEHLTITAVMDEHGVVTNYVATLTDITMSKAAAEEIQQLAFFDPLTRLPNRRLLVDRLNQALVSSARNGVGGAVLFLDLDHFKTLNDTLGHDIGDLMLQQVAQRLTDCVREGDTVSRLGGDEYVVMLEHLSEQAIEAAAQAEVVGEKILAALNQPYQLASHEYYSTASIGIALFSDHNQSQENLLKHADIAMYQAKKEGRNSLRFFDPKMQDVIDARVLLENDLRKALENKEFQLYYQVQVNSLDHPLGAEALIRWHHPKRGLVSPFNFIPLAEETGLILPIGLWVLDTACAQLKAWEQNELTHNVTISINVSAKQFNQADFVAQVQAAVQRHAINPMLLKLELTESMLVNHIDNIIITMVALQAIGVRFELDDFGTGYSSLQYLKQLPLHQLKIDQSFIRDIATDSSDQAIVRTIIVMAQSLNLVVIAEGVETEQQRQFLLDNGCNHYQGYLFSKPVPVEKFEELLKEV